MGQASAYLSAGRVADAEGAYNAVLAEDPSDYRAHLGLADCVSARGLSDWAVDHLVEHARAYAEQGQMRGAFALMTKALAVAPSRLDLHIDVAEFEALEGRAEMAAQRLENLARTYITHGQEEEAELVLEAAAAFRTTPAPRPSATPPPPPPTSRATAVPRPIEPTPTPTGAMVRPSPLLQRSAAPPPPPPKKTTQVLVAPKPKRSSRGHASGPAPKWRPSTVTKDPPPRPTKASAATKAVEINDPPRPRKPAAPIASYPKARPSLVAAPSPKRGGKKLDALPPLRGPSLADRLRAASSSAPVGDEDRTSMWRPPT